MIPQNIIDNIRDRIDIVQVIGSMLDLKRSGRNFKALCPFHGEKTPSFMVSPEKQIYHCFGCGKGGNVFNFLMDYEGISFVEAVRRLGKDLGIDVGRYVEKGEDRGKLDPYYQAMEFAVGYYQGMLRKGQDAEKVRKYLEDREIDNELIDLFGIGFAPSGWDHFYRAASDKGIPRNILLEMNLVMRSRGGSGYRDYFRNRVIFPIAMISDRVVGLAGRVLDDSEPEYLNTAESPIYSKGRILYGLNQSKGEIRKIGSAIVVEGYIDYLMLWKKGVRNLCAVCGTSLTEDQARLLARYANRVYIINDGDRAGIRAAVRAADLLIVEGLDAQIVVLPEGEDPDSFTRKRGADALLDMMRSAPSYFHYLKAEAEKGTRTTYKKSQVVNHLLETVSRVRDGIRKELYLQEISDLFGVPLDTIRSGLKKGRKQRQAAEFPKTDDTRRRKFQRLVFRVGLEDERYARMILDNLVEEDIDGHVFRGYYKALDLALKKHIDIKSQDFIGAIEDSELCKLSSEIALIQPPPGPIEEFLSDTLVWLRKAALRDEMGLMKKRLMELRSEPKADTAAEEIEIAETYRKVARELKNMGLKEDDQSDGSR
ncbi:MAG: DNA primase [Candidatus Krumholzibacteria bacterium]|nr:DNA primase [Candidatus Krumholzibacteria bacterium]